MLLLQQVGQGAGREGKDLLGVFSTHISSTNSNPLDASALCVYPLDELDRHIDSTRDLCYTQDGRVEGKGEVAYIEYEVKSSCANLPPVKTQERKGLGIFKQSSLSITCSYKTLKLLFLSGPLRIACYSVFCFVCLLHYA